MPNDKTAPAPTPPVARDGWVRKCDEDDYLTRASPPEATRNTGGSGRPSAS